MKLQPFAVDSPWNVSLGSGAVFESSTDVKTNNLLTGTSFSYINAAQHSVAVNVARFNDPQTTFTMPGSWVYRHPAPLDVKIAVGDDKLAAVLDGRTSWEYWGAARTGTLDYSANFAGRPALDGQGMSGGVRASRFSIMGGLIRKHELDVLSIPHALILALHDAQLKQGWVWPASMEDENAAAAYTGEIPMGTLVGIPPSVDLAAQGLTAEGLALATALQDFGAYVGDRSTNVLLYAEPECEGAAIQRMRDDFASKVWPLLRVITNSTPSTVGGGGTRRKPAAKPLNI